MSNLNKEDLKVLAEVVIETTKAMNKVGNYNMSDGNILAQKELDEQLKRKSYQPESFKDIDNIIGKKIQEGLERSDKITGIYAGEYVERVPIQSPVEDTSDGTRKILYPHAISLPFEGGLITYEWKDAGETVWVHGIHAEYVKQDFNKRMSSWDSSKIIETNIVTGEKQTRLFK